MTPLPQAAREQREIAFWTESPTESPGADSLDALTLKMAEGRILLEKLREYAGEIRDAHTVLELGGGQGWAACFLRHEYPEVPVVISSDIAPDAIVSLREWERVLGVRLDGAFACRSNEVPVADGSVDLAVVFAAAHHFGAHRRTLQEIGRLLAPGGRALYMHEPGCRRYIYPLALKRVMAKRPVVPEDVLRYEEIVELATSVGLEAEVRFSPSLTFRGPTETVYYLALRRATFLQRWLPCTVDLVFTKPA